MSNLATAEHLRRATSQLPVSWYFDPAVFAVEQQLPVRARPRLRRPRADGAESGRLSLARWMRQRAGAGPQRARVSSSSPTSAATARRSCSKGRGNAQNIVCPVHRWTYDLKGRAARRAAFRRQPLPEPRPDSAAELERPAVRRPARRPRGSGGARRARLRFLRLHARPGRGPRVSHNWKTFIEVYLEDYHVVPFHPGLGNFVSCDDLKWEFARVGSLQTVGITSLGKAGTKTYESAGTRPCSTTTAATRPKHGAIWLTYYPNVMLEWYPHVLVISTLYSARRRPHDQRRRVLLPRGHRLFEREFVEAEQAAYIETARRGRGDRRADGRRSPRTLQRGPQRRRAVPVADGRRHAALPRVPAARARHARRAALSGCGTGSGCSGPRKCNNLASFRASSRTFHAGLATRPGARVDVRCLALRGPELSGLVVESRAIRARTQHRPTGQHPVHLLVHLRRAGPGHVAGDERRARGQRLFGQLEPHDRAEARRAVRSVAGRGIDGRDRDDHLRRPPPREDGLDGQRQEWNRRPGPRNVESGVAGPKLLRALAQQRLPAAGGDIRPGVADINAEFTPWRPADVDVGRLRQPRPGLHLRR